MIVDVTDFLKRPYKIPNQPESLDFQEFVEKAEIELATKYLLGWELWDEFNEAVNGSGSIPAAMVALRDGGEYEYNGVTYKYLGWVDMLVPGIYSMWLPEVESKQTNVGRVQNRTPQQAVVVEDQYPFIVGSWNQFVRKVGVNCRNSFYGFLKANEDDYSTWEFNCPPFKNRFDL